jgi:hypothetical protein
MASTRCPEENDALVLEASGKNACGELGELTVSGLVGRLAGCRRIVVGDGGDSVTVTDVTRTRRAWTKAGGGC